MMPNTYNPPDEYDTNRLDVNQDESSGKKNFQMAFEIIKTPNRRRQNTNMDLYRDTILKKDFEISVEGKSKRAVSQLGLS